MRLWSFAVLLFLVMSLPVNHLRADVIGFDIQLNITGFTPSQTAIFNSAAATWESYITGYKDNVSNTVLTINATAATIDGVGGVLGSAGPSTGKALVSGRYLYAQSGAMQFDSGGFSFCRFQAAMSPVP